MAILSPLRISQFSAVITSKEQARKSLPHPLNNHPSFPTSICITSSNQNDIKEKPRSKVKPNLFTDLTVESDESSNLKTDDLLSELSESDEVYNGEINEFQKKHFDEPANNENQETDCHAQKDESDVTITRRINEQIIQGIVKSPQ